MTPMVTHIALPVNCGSIRIKHTPVQGRIVPEHNQIVIAFPNGYEMSIVYGAQVYSSNSHGSRFEPQIPENEAASTVEIAITAPDGQSVPFKDGENVKGFVPLTELLTIINWVSTR